jgi:hypothetical protein
MTTVTNTEEVPTINLVNVSELVNGKRLAMVQNDAEEFDSPYKYRFLLRSDKPEVTGYFDELPSSLRPEIFGPTRAPAGHMIVMLDDDGNPSDEMKNWLKDHNLCLSARNNTVNGPYIYGVPTLKTGPALPILKRVQLETSTFKGSNTKAFLNQEFDRLGWISFYLPGACTTEGDVQSWKEYDRSDTARMYLTNADEKVQFLETKELVGKFNRACPNFFLLGIKLEKDKRNKLFYLPKGMSSKWREFIESKYGLKFSTERPEVKKPTKKRNSILDGFYERRKQAKQRKLDVNVETQNSEKVPTVTL